MNLLGILLVSVFAIGHCAVPDGFILEVTPSCGDDFALITVTSDLYVDIIADCDGEEITDTLGGSDVQKVINASYSEKPASPDGFCYFKRASAASEVYTLDIVMFWRPLQDGPALQKEAKRITCALGDYAIEEKTIQKAESPFAADDLTEMKGNNDQDSAVDLKVLDVLGTELTSSIPLGKSVRLSATIDSAGGKLGLVPVNCQAFNSDNTKSYRVISGGCGDGVVFQRNEGFTTSGLTSVSPYFKMFDLDSVASDVIFKCNFTACSTACDGSSCHSSARRKRSAEEKNGEPIHDKSAVVVASSPVLKLRHAQPVSSDQPSGEVLQLIVDNHKERLYTAIAVIATLVGVSLLMSLYLCVRRERSPRESECKCARPCPQNRCQCPENIPFLRNV